MRFAARIFAAGLLAFGLSLGPAVAASASSGVTITWVTYTGSYSHTYSCSGTATYYGWDVSYVSNGCGDRVWLHAQENGSGAAYCVTPVPKHMAQSATTSRSSSRPIGCRVITA